MKDVLKALAAMVGITVIMTLMATMLGAAVAVVLVFVAPDLSDAAFDALFEQNMNTWQLAVYAVTALPYLWWVYRINRKGSCQVMPVSPFAQVAPADSVESAGEGDPAASPVASADAGSKAAVSSSSVAMPPADPAAPSEAPVAPISETAPDFNTAYRPAAKPRPLRIRFGFRSLAARDLLLLALLAVGLGGVSDLVMSFISVALPQEFSDYTQMVEGSGLMQYGITWFLATIVAPPLLEETVFRGLGLGYLCRSGMPFLAANIIQAALFGLFHMNLTQGLYAFAIGLVMGDVARRYNNLAAPMVVHAAFNLWGTVGSQFLAWAFPVEVLVAITFGSLAVFFLAYRRLPRPHTELVAPDIAA